MTTATFNIELHVEVQADWENSEAVNEIADELLRAVDLHPSVTRSWVIEVEVA